MLRVKNVIKSIDKEDILKNISLEVEEGSIYGLIGPNGAGKTTLIRTITGIIRPDSGEITLNGKNIIEEKSARADIAYVQDFLTFYPDFKVKDMKDFYKGMYPSFSEERYKNLRQLFTFSEKKRIKHLSKGMRTQLALQMAFCINPKLMVLDEPTSGLDPVMRREILNLIVQQVSNFGTSVLISTHNILELEQICDSIGMINKGEILLQDSMENLKGNIKKIQVVFKSELPIEIKEMSEMVKIESQGKVHQLVVMGDIESVEKKIESHKPVLMETIDLTLEEIFLYRIGGEGYVLKNIAL